jgi:periplasmic protein CpxP/Spy
MRFARKISALGALMLTTGAIALSTSTALFAQSNPNPSPRNNTPGMQRTDRGAMRQGMEDRMARELNLTPEQVSRSQAIRQQYQAQITPLEQQLRQAREEMKTLLASATATDSQIRGKHQQIQQLHQQIETLRFDGRLAFRQILTPEQRQTLAQRMASRPEGRHRERTPGS